MPFARYFCIFINVGLGEAAKRNVGTGDNQIPDMGAFASGSGWFRLPGGYIVQFGTFSGNTTSFISGHFPIPFPNQPLVWLDYEVNADGSILVKTYHRTHLAAPVFARNEITGLTDGEPIDIPKDQFVSVRVEMPESSIWSQKQKAIPEECEVISD